MDDAINIIKSVLSWPTVTLIIILFFNRQLRKLLQALINKRASIKLPGNIELSLDDIHDHGAQEKVKDEKLIAKELSQALSKLTDKSPASLKSHIENIFEEQRLAQLKLYLQTISYQLIAWLYFNRHGKPFGLMNLINQEYIPIVYKDVKSGEYSYCISSTHEEDVKCKAYCIHSTYEKDAVASEFRRSLLSLERYGLLKRTDKNNVQVSQDSKIIEILSNAMKDVVHTESERDKIDLFVEKFLIPSESKKMIDDIEESKSDSEDNNNESKGKHN